MPTIVRLIYEFQSLAKDKKHRPLLQRPLFKYDGRLFNANGCLSSIVYDSKYLIDCEESDWILTFGPTYGGAKLACTSEELIARTGSTRFKRLPEGVCTIAYVEQPWYSNEFKSIC